MEGCEIIQRFDRKIDEFTAFQQHVLDEGSKDTSAQVDSVKNWVLLLGLIAVLIGIAIAWHAGRIIAKPIVAIARSAERIATGDLNGEDIIIPIKDELGELARSFNQMSRNLRELIHQVGSNAKQVTASAEELTAGSEQTSRATEQIAATMQVVAADTDKQFRSIEVASETVGELSIGAKQIAAHATKASASAHALSRMAEHLQMLIDKFTI